MEKIKLYLFAIIPTILITVLSCIIFYNLNSTKIKTISTNLKLIDGNLDHNQALDVIEAAKNQNIEIPTTIINFDTHSDMYVFEKINPDYGARVSNWLNIFFAQNQADTLYWVMPDKEATNQDMINEFLDQDNPNYTGCLYGNSLKSPKSINFHVEKTPFIQYFALNTANGWMREIISPDENLDAGFKKIKIVTCTQDSLPDFKDKNVILSIDSDYISNSGFDTLADFTNNRNKHEINQEISKLLSTIRRKNIRPQIISLTLSPDYVPEEDQQQLFSFIQEFIKHSGKKDYLQEYSHQMNKPKIKTGAKKYPGF